jgi:hypothetical protein
MATYPSARGQKPAEIAHRPEGRNTIVTVWLSNGVATTAYGPDYESVAGTLTIEQCLDETITMGRVPLLWTYAKHDANYTELKFGFDDPIAGNKIGHVALTEEATISGEIRRGGGGWRINNESGAWGNMGGHGGKTHMMQEAAVFMTTHCGGMVVTADHAYSRKGWKRTVQQIFR